MWFLQDAWLDSLDVAPQLASARSVREKSPDENQELSSQEIGILKRRIANLLEPEETVIFSLYFTLVLHVSAVGCRGMVVWLYGSHASLGFEFL